jgi:hypothetical protein
MDTMKSSFELLTVRKLRGAQVSSQVSDMAWLHRPGALVVRTEVFRITDLSCYIVNGPLTGTENCYSYGKILDHTGTEPTMFRHILLSTAMQSGYESETNPHLYSIGWCSLDE